jgi:hypothetical protein
MEPAAESSAFATNLPTTQQESERVKTLMKSRNAPSSHPEHCLDCGQTISGHYCANCGQETTAHTLTMRELARDAVGEFVSTDSKFFRTLRKLLFSPGALTADYVAGRRERYLMPSRMFLVLSVIFFFVLSLTQSLIQVPFSENVITMTFEKGEIQAAFQASGLSQEMFLEKLDSAFTAALPIMLLLMVPLFAGMMRLINLTSGYRFIVHLVFSFHLFSFVAAATVVAFWVLVLLGLVAMVAGEEAMDVLAVILMSVVAIYLPIYTMIALRKVYDYSWLGVFIETVVLFVVGGVIGVAYLSMVAGFALGFVGQ